MRQTLSTSVYQVRLAVTITAILLTAGLARIDAQGCAELSFTAAAPAAVGAYPAAIASGDFNGDAHLDLAVANYSSDNVSVLLSNGSGGFALAVNYGGVSSPYSMAVGDIDGDGDLDLAIVNSGTSDVTVLKGDGLGAFTFACRFAVGIQPYSITIADFNADGHLDLATANYFSNNVSVLIGNGLGGFAPAAGFAAGVTPIAIAAGDFDQNGTTDLAVDNYASDTVTILHGNGSGSFISAGSYAVGSLPSTIAVGDFNSDGKLDVAAANETGTVSVLRNNGAGGFSPATNWSTGNTPFGIAVGDFNLDGKTDIATANFGSDNASVLLGTGGGSFASAVNFAAGSQPGGLVIGDLNGDGSRDLAIANRSSNNVSILLNGCAGNSAPTISSVATSRQQGAGPSRSMIASVSDTEDPPSALSVKVNAGTSATVNGVTVSNITINTAGDTEADVVASCGATNASFTLRVTDSGGLFAESVLNVGVTPSGPPVVLLRSPISFFPHNGKLREISVGQMVKSADDDCDIDVSGNVVIEKVTSDEVDGKSSATSNDILIGSDCRSVQLRASRNNNGDGRVYLVTLRVTDLSGNITHAVFKVRVPLGPNGPAGEGPPTITVESSCH
jgi:hypothetical protein